MNGCAVADKIKKLDSKVDLYIQLKMVGSFK